MAYRKHPSERIKFIEYMAGIIRQANDQAEPEEDIELFRQSPNGPNEVYRPLMKWWRRRLVVEM